MKKLIQNKKLVILSSVALILCVGIVVWACVSCTSNDPYKGFSEEGMDVVDVKKEETSEENKDSDKEENQMSEDETKAPSNWGKEETPSLDAGGNQSQNPDNGSNNEEKEESKEENPNTESGYGRPF